MVTAHVMTGVSILLNAHVQPGNIHMHVSVSVCTVCACFSVGVCQFVFISLVKAPSPFVNKPRWPSRKANMLMQSE